MNPQDASFYNRPGATNPAPETQDAPIIGNETTTNIVMSPPAVPGIGSDPSPVGGWRAGAEPEGKPESEIEK